MQQTVLTKLKIAPSNSPAEDGFALALQESSSRKSLRTNCLQFGPTSLVALCEIGLAHCNQVAAQSLRYASSSWTDGQLM